jgi:hypothetical protein
MTDPARYLRQTYSQALQGTCIVYDTLAPVGASLPYAVIKVSFNGIPVKESSMYRCSVNLQLFAEAGEYIGQKVLDEIGDAVITAMIKKGNSTYLTVSGFDHIGAKVVSISNDFNQDDAKTIMTKTLIIEHTLDTQ